MAQYYVDGTISSVSGSGSGTLADPWGKTDDLLQYAVDQILAGAGAGATGDWVNIIAGDLTATASVDLSSYSGSTKNLYIVGYNGHQPTYDLGGETMFATNYDSIGLHNIRFINFSNTVSSIFIKYRGFVTKCIFDGQDQDYKLILEVSGAVNIFGCRWINFSPSPSTNHGYLFKTGSHGGNWIKGCYFEKGGNDNASMLFTYNSVIEDCIFRYSGTESMGYMILPIKNLRLSNCTFYATPAAAGNVNATFFSTYVENSMINCYFENLQEPIYNSVVTVNDNSSTMLVGNRAYNSSNVFPDQDYFTGKTVIYEDNDWDVSESLLVDPLNGDYRPKAGLIGAGFNLQDYGFPSSIKRAKPTIGGIGAFETTAKPVTRMRG